MDGYLMLAPHEEKIRRRFGSSGAGVPARPSAQSNLLDGSVFAVRESGNWDGMAESERVMVSSRCGFFGAVCGFSCLVRSFLGPFLYANPGGFIFVVFQK
jgi:hypothetical protein